MPENICNFEGGESGEFVKRGENNEGGKDNKWWVLWEKKQESCKSKSIAISSCNKQQVEKTTQLERKLQQIGKIANHSILYNIFASSFRNESVDSNRLQWFVEKGWRIQF